MGFQLGVVHPITDPSSEETLRETMAAVLPEDAEVLMLPAARGPGFIESSVDEVVGAGEVLEILRETDGLDAYVLACFSDPGIHAARELVSAPVVGQAEAAYVSAALVSRRFAVLTTMRRGVPALEDRMRELGMSERCVAVLPTAVPVSEQATNRTGATAALQEIGQRAVKELGAEALVLACASMGPAAPLLSERLGVPVCDGIAFSALLAHSLWRAGLRTSKAGAYSSPEAIAYLGMEPFARGMSRPDAQETRAVFSDSRAPSLLTDPPDLREEVGGRALPTREDLI